MGHNSVPSLGDLVHEAPDPPISNEIMSYLADWHKNMSVCLAEVTHQAPGITHPEGVVGLHRSRRHGVPGPLNPADGCAPPPPL